MAKIGRPKTDWATIQVSNDKGMSAPEAAKFLGIKLNTLHVQLIRNRCNCQTDGHVTKNASGHWVIHSSIREVFAQES